MSLNNIEDFSGSFSFLYMSPLPVRDICFPRLLGNNTFIIDLVTLLTLEPRNSFNILTQVKQILKLTL